MLVPPPPPQERDGSVPRVYAAAADLSHGARVVAGFGDQVVLYCVPPDVLQTSRDEQKGLSGTDVDGNGTGAMEDVSMPEWLRWLPGTVQWDGNGEGGPLKLWPLYIEGIVIGSLRGLMDVAVNHSPDLTVWGYAFDGQAATWEIRTAKNETETAAERTVGRDGIVMDLFEMDADGDVVMTDTEPVMETNDREPTIGFDGQGRGGSLRRWRKALALECDDGVEAVVPPEGSWYDEEGNVWLIDAGE